jgi:hemerythrin-like domain-containing protein
MTERVQHRLQPAADSSRADRDASLDAVLALEEALAEPTPGREVEWLRGVHDTVDALAGALDVQASGDAEAASLLSEIADEEPRLRPRIERLRREHQDLRDAVASLRQQIDHHPDAGVDVADIRERLAAIARRMRQHRAREADLVYEAVNINLGAGD